MINNKKEYHQPRDVQIRYEKNENEEMKKRKQAAQNVKNNSVEENNHAQDKPQQTKQNTDTVGTTTIAQFIRNMRAENEKLTFTCDQCDYKTKSNESLKTHIESAHETNEFKCNQCDYKTKKQR